MPFSRPSNIPSPTVWHRFSVPSVPTSAPSVPTIAPSVPTSAPSVPTNASSVQLRVQDLTSNLEEEALSLLERHFTADEPPCRCIRINDHPSALAELKKLWKKTVGDGLSVVCLTEDDEIVGVNVLTVACSDNDDEDFQTDDNVWAQLFGAVDAVARSVNVFEMYNVDHFLNAYGLVVAPKWRGMKIGSEILRARVPLCQALGIKVTATVFTAAASQAVAEKAGFKTIAEITYEDLAKMGYVFPRIGELTKSSKLMALVVE